MKFTTIIFDLDGTLMNTLDDLHTSVSFALSAIGLKPNEKSDTRRYLGNGVRALVWESVTQAMPAASEQMKEQALAAFRKHYMAHSMDRTAPYDGVSEMLHECKAKGILTAIVSNKPDAAVKMLHDHFFSDTIDVAIGESSALCKKPAPDMVDEAIRRLSHIHGREIDKKECVYVGDSEVDIQTAQNAGLQCMAVSWGFRDRDWLEQHGAETIVERPEDLLCQ